MVNTRAKARFALAYKQLLPTEQIEDRNSSLVRVSEVELDRRFAAIKIPSDAIKLGHEVRCRSLPVPRCQLHLWP